MTLRPTTTQMYMTATPVMMPSVTSLKCWKACEVGDGCAAVIQLVTYEATLVAISTNHMAEATYIECCGDALIWLLWLLWEL